MNRALPAALVLALALTGCASDSTDDAASTNSSPPATSATAPVVTAPTPGVGTTDGDTFTYEGVTVTGARDEAPTITLADDFGPATDLLVSDVYEGSGDPVASPQAVVTVNYVGMGEQSREVFDSSWERGKPATFALDGGIIAGWTQGLLGMQPGGRRLLIIPGSLAYGAGGNPPIGPDETLVFVVDLIEAVPAP